MAADNTVKQSVAERLAGLKFMQRAKIRDDERKQEAEELGSTMTDDSDWVTPKAANSRCKVIIEGDPQPDNIIGRMSFGGCNPAVEKLQEEASARRNKLRNAASGLSGKEEERAINTPQASANYVKPENLEAHDAEKISIKKRQKVKMVNVEKVTMTKTESTFIKPNSFAILRDGNKETNKHHHQCGTKLVNTDRRS